LIYEIIDPKLHKTLDKNEVASKCEVKNPLDWGEEDEVEKKKHRNREFIGMTWLCYARSKPVALPLVAL
jgi:hypothetical protein